jgi:type III restriction enzyme
VVCPNLTIKERLSVLRPGDPNNYFEMFDLVPSSLRPELAKGKVLVTNWHWLAPEAEVQKVGGAPIVQLGAEAGSLRQNPPGRPVGRRALDGLER